MDLPIHLHFSINICRQNARHIPNKYLFRNGSLIENKVIMPFLYIFGHRRPAAIKYHLHLVEKGCPFRTFSVIFHIPREIISLFYFIFSDKSS